MPPSSSSATRGGSRRYHQDVRLWLPAFHPIRGHWWLLKSIARDDTAATAQADAPWRNYTTLPVHLDANFGRARIDWWGLLWLKDYQERADNLAKGTNAAATAKAQADADAVFRMGLVLLVLMIAGLVFGIWSWLRFHRSARDSTESSIIT